ncbi:MAG: hypothetical protein KA498_13000, partial [Neisseriaceae bacterium]|nr:hypothetical protein [Neisseriaceae bacterium]
SLLISRWVSPCRAPSFLFDVKKKRSKEKPPTLSARFAGALVGPHVAGGKNSYLGLRPNTQTTLPQSPGPARTASAAKRGTVLHLKASVVSLKCFNSKPGFTQTTNHGFRLF